MFCWSASQNGFRCNHQDRLPHNFPSFSSLLSNRSIGVLTYVMLTGESPFLGDDKQQTFLNISQINIDYSQDTFEGISSLAIDFIKSLLVKNPGWAFFSQIYWLWLILKMASLWGVLRNKVVCQVYPPVFQNVNVVKSNWRHLSEKSFPLLQIVVVLT